MKSLTESFEQLEARKLLAADLPALADAYVRDGASAASNFGSATQLIAKRSANVGNSREAFIRFNIGSTSVAAGQTFKLRLYGRLADTQNNNLPVALYPVASTNWGESAITWNSKPAAGATSLDSETISGTAAAWYEWDVTSYVIDAKTNGASAVSFALRSTNVSDTQIVFNAEEGSSNDPVLRVSDPATEPPPPGGTTTTTLPISIASYVRGGTYGNTNFGTTTDLLVKRSASADNVRETYLQFDLSTIPNITGAKLRLFGGLSAAGSVQVAAYSAGSNWTEGGITYNTRPSTGTTILASTTLTSTTKGWHEFDLTSFLQAEKAAGRNVVSIALKAPNITDPWATFNADGATSSKPELVVTSSGTVGRAVNVAVNLGSTIQMIEGLGSAMIAWIPRNPSTPLRAEYEDPAFYDKIVGDLGASMARIPIWPTFEAVNDDDDPNHFNWAGFDDDAIARTLTFLQRLKDRGVTRFVATVWTPPAWMKTNGSHYDGGMLRPDLRDEFAEYIAAFAIVARDQFGIQMTGISLQNEPLFVQEYESAIVTPEQFREIVRAVNRKLDAEGLTSVKIILPEDVNSSDRYDWYVAPTLADAETRAAVDVLASHGTQTDHWNAMGPLIDNYRTQYGKPFWLTEASGHATTWAGALTMGTQIHDALVRGDASAYLYWQWSESASQSQFSLMIDGQPTAKYHVAKHFMRYIRPGAVRVSATTSDTGLRVASFKHPTSGAVTHVLINTGTSAANVTLNHTGSGAAASYKQYRTSSGENHVRLADVAGGATVNVSIPASSIVTLYSGPDLVATPATSGGPLPGVQRIDVPPHSVYDSAASGSLRTAAMTGDLATVQSLIAGGANVNATSAAGWTPLHVAAASPYTNSVAIINALLDAGAEINRVTLDGWTPLHVAAANGTATNGGSTNLGRDKVNALLAGGATSLINARDVNGRTALHWAGYVTKVNLSPRTEDATVVNALLTGGANKTLLDDLGKTARDYALSEGNTAAANALV